MTLTDICERIADLRVAGVLDSIKVETEGEGASWELIHLLSAVSHSVGVDLCVKIGGCEAKTDLRMASWLGVGGVTAPMVESRFAVMKFSQAINSVFGDSPPRQRMVLVESVVGTANIDSILSAAQSFATGINFGRSDLSASLRDSSGRSDIDQDGDEVMTLVGKCVALASAVGFQTTVGGRLTSASIESITRHCGDLLHRVETKRFVLNWQSLRERPDYLDQVLGVELQLAEYALHLTARPFRETSQLVGELQSRITTRPARPDFP